MVSVVIPLFNKGNCIERTISSVLDQTYRNFELIIVNDGSTDNSLNAVNRITDTRICVITQENNGVSSARNEGISRSKYDLVALLDADDLWHNSFLEEMVNLTIDFPEASLFGCSWAYINSEGKETVSDYGLQKDFRDYVSNYFKIATENILFNASSVVLDKKAFYELGKFDEALRIGEDLDLWIRFALKKKLAYINKPLSYYLIGAENRASVRSKNREECLVWNLSRYKEYEKLDPDLKKFLDTWRFHQVIDFFEGRRNELDEAKSLIKEINLNNYAFFWKLLRYTPKVAHTFLYKLRIRYINFKRSIKSRISKLKF
jgi:glycosyltransferase involved in cell wall biosynthesis